MLQQQARVIALNDDDTVQVVTIRQSACGSCQQSCLPETAQHQHHELAARIGHDPLQQGDRVLIAIAEKTVWQGLLGLYAVPLGAMVLGSVMGQQWAGDSGALLGCMLMLSIVLLLFRHITLRHRQQYLPIVIKKLSC